MEDKIYVSEPLIIENEQKNFPISFGVILGLQILSIIFIAWITTSLGNSGMPFFDVLGALFFSILGMVIFLILGIVGWIQSKKLEKKNYKKSSVLLLFSSVLMTTMIVPNYLAGTLGNIFSPYVKEKQVELTQKATEKSVAEFNSAPEVHYKYLSELFQQPQKIIDAKYRYLLLDNGHMLKLFGFYSLGENEVAFEKYAKEFLVGNNIKINLPDYPDFANTYFPNSRTIFVDGKWPKDPELNIYYGIIPVLILKDKELINLRYSAGNKLEKYTNKISL